MSGQIQSDSVLVERVRRGEPDAWTELIARYEGRLLAFVDTRLRKRSASEDVVQETLIGLLTSLPNYDQRRPLEGYIFSICAHKLTDYLRREGRRPAIPLSTTDGSDSPREIPGPARRASSIHQSGERRGLEEAALSAAIAKQIDGLRERGDWTKINCLELLFVRGIGNKEAAGSLRLTEQQVANYKFEFLAKLRDTVRKQGLSEDVFPELANN